MASLLTGQHNQEIAPMPIEFANCKLTTLHPLHPSAESAYERKIICTENAVYGSMLFEYTTREESSRKTLMD